MEQKLKGKVALVTGAARGLGRSYALRLAALGADVGVIDIDLQSWRAFEQEAAAMTAPTTMDEVRALGCRSAGALADVASFAQVQAAVAAIVAELGEIDILVCNAGGGIGGQKENAASCMDLQQYHAVIDRNLHGTVNTVTAVAPMMKRKGSGRIVTVCSQAGLGVTREGTFAHYGTAKAAIRQYTQYLSADLGPYGINVNCLAPGFIMTARISDLFMNNPESPDYIAHTSLRRFGTPEECAKVVEFLVTDLSDFVTGACIDVTGGAIDKLAF